MDSLLCVCVCVWEFIYIWNVCVGTDLAPTVAVMKQSDQKQLTREQDSSDWYKSSQREKLGADLKTLRAGLLSGS